MSRSLLKLITLAVLALGAWVGMFCYEHQSANPVKRAQNARAAEAAAETKELRDLAGRLAAQPRRVAGLLVEKPTPEDGSAAGQDRTVLLFQEFAGDGSTLPIKRFTFEGRTVHIESMVLQFQGPFINGREALRGASLPLFLRLRGEKGTADTSLPIDEPGRTPAVYRGPEVTVSDFERQLWRDIWRVATDEAYRARTGVRALGGHIDFGPLETGRMYTLTLNPDASLSVTSAPLTPEAMEALKNDERKVVPQTGPSTRTGATTAP